MKLARFARVALSVAALAGTFGSAAMAQTTSYYNAGFFDYTVGAGVTTLDVTLAGGFGGSGGSGGSGAGGLMTARLSGLTTGQVLRIVIGAGQNNISNGSGGLGFDGVMTIGNGGELSAIALGSGTNLSSLNYLLIAGGGGGAFGSDGGDGGGLVGETGADNFAFGNPAPGQGGSQVAGGAAGVSGGSNATAGSFLQGGAGSTSGNVAQGGGAGPGGGGGYYGGGGAAGTAGGGGGSSFASSSAVSGITVSDVINTQGGAVRAISGGDIGPDSEGSINGAGYATLTVVNASATAAPEPGSIALALTTGVPLLGIIRRRKAVKAGR